MRDGFVYTQENRNSLRSLQKFFPEIKRSQYKNRSIYYLEDKNKLALLEMMKHNKSRIVSYQDLGRLSKVFGANLDVRQKRGLLGKNLKPKRYKIRNFRKQPQCFSKEKQSILDDFLGRFLHSEVLRGYCKI